MPETLGKEEMKNYLSFGGGVNSVATMLLFNDLEIEYEAVMVWMPEYPETHDYVLMLENLGYKISIITSANLAKGTKTGNLYEYCQIMKMFPQRNPRWCTVKFKIKPLQEYFCKPAFVNIAIDYGEAHRATMKSVGALEYRYPLIEWEYDRAKCIELIKHHGLPVPRKSGCFICPFQTVKNIRDMRRYHPDLFCKLITLEKDNNEYRKSIGKEPYYTRGKPYDVLVNESDRYLFDEMAYPPCECGL